MSIKGKTNNPNGRPKGVPNKSTDDLRKSVRDLLDNNWERIQEDLNALEPKDRLMFLEKLLGYSLPKFTAVQQETMVIHKLEAMDEIELLKIANRIIDEI